MSSDTSSISEHQGRITEAQLQSLNVQARISTPDTDITEGLQQPDITIFCEKCKSFVLVSLLQEHRKYHSALVVLSYKGSQRPDSVAALLKRRQVVLEKFTRKLQDDRPLSMTTMQKINDAYELLKSYLEGTYDLLQTKEVVYPECRGLALTCSASCAHALGICSHDNQRWKNSMEDTRVFQDYFGNDSKKCFFAIYDGHSGRFAADIAANDLHHILLGEMAKFDPATSCTCTVNLAGNNNLVGYKLNRPEPIIHKDSIRHLLHEESRNIIQQIMHTCEENLSASELNPGSSPPGKEPRSKIPNRCDNDPFAEKMESAFRSAYQLTDYILSYGIDEQSRVRWSGCSAVTCVIKDTGSTEESEEDRQEADNEGSSEVKELGVLYIANAGNSQAVLCQNGQAIKLTRCHTPQSSRERARITRAGSSVKDGGHAGRVNGVLNTTRGLGNHGDPVLKAAILVEPHTLSVTINCQSDFLILASSGLWEVLSESEAVSLVQQLIPGREVSPLQGTSTSDDPLRDLYGVSKLDPDSSIGADKCAAEDEAESLTNQKLSKGVEAHWTTAEHNDVTKETMNTSTVTETGPKASKPYSSAIDDSSLAQSSDTKDDEDASSQTAFESMISVLMDDDGNEADIETLTELNTIYAQSRLLEDVEQDDQTQNEMYRNLAQQMSERLVQSALLAGSRDNITVLVILLSGCKL